MNGDKIYFKNLYWFVWSIIDPKASKVDFQGFKKGLPRKDSDQQGC